MSHMSDTPVGSVSREVSVLSPAALGARPPAHTFCLSPRHAPRGAVGGSRDRRRLLIPGRDGDRPLPSVGGSTAQCWQQPGARSQWLRPCTTAATLAGRRVRGEATRTQQLTPAEAQPWPTCPSLPVPLTRFTCQLLPQFTTFSLSPSDGILHIQLNI